MIEYVVGPVLALLISLKFGQVKTKKQEEVISDLTARVEAIETKVDVIDKETLKKMLVTVSPVAKAVKELQEAVGIQWISKRLSQLHSAVSRAQT